MTHLVVHEVRSPLRDHPFPYQVAIIRPPTGVSMQIDSGIRKKLANTTTENHVQISTDLAVDQLLRQIVTAARCLRVVLPVTGCGFCVSRL